MLSKLEELRKESSFTFRLFWAERTAKVGYRFN